MNSVNTSPTRKYLYGSLSLLALALFCVGAAAFISDLSSEAPPKKKKQVQMISIIKPPEPPPPPKIERPPEPKLEEPVELAEEEPIPETPDLADDAPPSEALGLEGEGGAGSDGFGLLGRGKGGRGLTEGHRFGWYAGVVKQGIYQALSEDEDVRRHKYTVVVKVWIDAGGGVTQVKLANSTGERRIDQAIIGALSSMGHLAEAPPADMPQPIKLRVRSKL